MHEKICPHCLSYMSDSELLGWMRCPACSFMIKKVKSMITMQELLMNRVKFEDLPADIQANGKDLLEKLNKFRKEYGQPMYVVSGYRRPEDNAATNGAKLSAHLSLQACDFKDSDGKLFEFIKKDPKVLDRCDLYMEDAQWTPNWIHLQNRKASTRIFIPNQSLPKDIKRKI